MIIIGMSAHNHCEESIEAGMNAFIMKPLRLDSFNIALQQVISEI